LFPTLQVGVVRFFSEHVLLIILIIIINISIVIINIIIIIMNSIINIIINISIIINIILTTSYSIYITNPYVCVSTIGDDGSRQVASDAEIVIRLL